MAEQVDHAFKVVDVSDPQKSQGIGVACNGVEGLDFGQPISDVRDVVDLGVAGETQFYKRFQWLTQQCMVDAGCAGVWSIGRHTDWFDDDTDTLVRWKESDDGQHIELGIAEGNLVGLLSELGLTWVRDGQPLYPVGTLYDPL